MADDRNRKTDPDELRIKPPRPRPETPGARGIPLPPVADAERAKRQAHEAFERRREPPAAIVTPVPTRLPQDAPAPSVAPQVDQALGRAVRAIVGKLWPIVLAGGLGTGGAVAYQQTTTPPAQVNRQGEQLSELRRRVNELEDEVALLAARDRAWQRWAVEQQDWQLQLLERQGVRVRRPDGLPPPTPIETSVPLRRPGRVTPGPSLEVVTPPPAPPNP